MQHSFQQLRTKLRRSHHGKLLGVFTGVAESQGWNVCGVRFFGVVILISIAGTLGVSGLTGTATAVGFFYLLFALLMRPPVTPEEALRMQAEPAEAPEAPYPTYRSVRPGPAGPFPTPAPAWAAGGGGSRVDLKQLDRQLDSLNRRIQRMETIVTDRQYDWDRRMNS